MSARVIRVSYIVCWLIWLGAGLLSRGANAAPWMYSLIGTGWLLFAIFPPGVTSDPATHVVSLRPGAANASLLILAVSVGVLAMKIFS